MLKVSKLFFFILPLILLNNHTMSLPRKLYNTKIITVNVSDLKTSGSTNTSEYIHTQRSILSKENYAVNGGDIGNIMDDKIIFPSDKNIRPQKYIPKPSPLCENLTFCESILNYPNDLVETALRMHKDLKFLPTLDLVPDVVHRINSSPEDYPLCESKEMIIYPKAAKNHNTEWMFILNHAEFTQSIRVETCGKENSACNLVDGFAEGYKTTCKQNYIYKQLMAVSLIGQIKPEIFRFPVSCCCRIKFVGDPLVRIGTDVIKKNRLLNSNSRKK